MIAGRLELLRSAITTALSVGLSSGVSDDGSWLARVVAPSTLFAVLAAQLRTHILNYYLVY